MKTCCRCGETKPLTDFPKRADARDGHRGYCRVCKRENDRLAMRRWRERNPELNRERARQWTETHREQERERWNRYDAENREKRRQAIAKSRREKPEHHRALRKSHYHRNKAVLTDRFYRYLEDVRYPTPETTEYIGILQHDPCSYCEQPMGAIDHIVPRSTGGTHDWTNLTAACQSCNPAKRNSPLLVWLAGRAMPFLS